MRSFLLVGILILSVQSFANADTCRLSKDAVKDYVRTEIVANVTQALQSINSQAQVKIDKYDVDVNVDFDVDDPEYGEIKVDEVVVKLNIPSAPEQTLLVRSQRDKKSGDDELELEDEKKFKIYLFETYGQFGEVVSCELLTHDPYFYLVNESTNQRIVVPINILLWDSTLAVMQ